MKHFMRQFSLNVCFFPKNKQKIDVIVLAKDFIEDLEETVMNLVLLEFLDIQ